MAAIVALVTLSAFKDLINEDVQNVDFVWRLCLGLGMHGLNNMTTSSSPRPTLLVRTILS